MKKTIVALAAFLQAFFCYAQTEFERFFTGECLRVDYELVGDSKSVSFVLKEMKMQGVWAGNLNVGDTCQMGSYRFSLLDSVSGKVLYQNGFSSLFDEWQQTQEACRCVQSFYHVSLMPFPKQTVKFRFEQMNRDKAGFSVLTEFYINPKNKFIRRESVNSYKHSIVHGGGDVNNKVDLAFLAEGYTAAQMDKFRRDVERAWQYMSGVEPFKTYSDMFNIYAVESLSAESGTDIPVKGIYRNTAMNFTFSTFDIDRYLTTFDTKAIHDAAASVPYDHIIILINSDEYGGGGFYNFYSAGTSDHELSLRVIVHEFGHGFAGLGDEYFYADEANEQMYSLNREPWEPNLTTLIDFESKWKNMLNPSTPVPTPRTAEYENVVGVFEGGGYMTKGMFSPAQDCIMRSNTPSEFCPVCRKAIERAILSHKTRH
ncbi:MAG: peptidase M64 [Salinivirgaceae bacterium]|nr:peptidase M64 [Salinivirgaceae bacterium]